MAPIEAPSIDWLAVGPVLALAAAGVAIVLAKALLRSRPVAMPVSLALALVGIIAAGALEFRLWNVVRDDGPITTMSQMLRVDLFAVFLGVVVLIATLLAVLLSVAYLRREGFEAPEYLALLLLSGAGMLAMTSANDLIVVFVALEVLSIPLYVLAAFDRRRASSQEAGIKYFVLGAFSSAVFLYGVALTYGATGTTSLTGIGQFLAQNTLLDQGTLLAGFALLLVGLGFKVAAVPFHMWTPDVYQGSPTPVTAFMSAATKAAAFAALLRVFGVAFPLYSTDWRPAVWVLAVLSLVVGSVAAVVQTDIKRMLAYSSIAHAGYVLMGFQTQTIRGREAALFYLFVYTFMSIGAFAVVTLATKQGDDKHSLDDYRGLALRRPVLGGFLIFFVLAQAGIPLTGGFVAKLEIFSATAKAQEYGLLIVGVLAAVVTTFFYLRIAMTLLSKREDDASGSVVMRRVDALSAVVLVGAGVMVLLIGIAPDTFIHWARDASFLL
ncbi:MAG: NADH-quinone oxidoreductase subunit N [Acidimicrobiia bacterium]|nr:NADH-quinone oxidoreductase subunit N [Acidimicrobiia bacterium]